MNAWWTDRSERERGAIAAVAALVVVLALLQFGLKPLVSLRQSAQADYESAMALLTQVETDAQRIDALRAEMPATSRVPARTAVSAVANAQGLTLTRLQPLENGELDVWLDDIASPALFTWLTTLADGHGLSVSRATLQQGALGLVNARITFAGGAP